MATTLLLGSLIAPTPAHAQVNCLTGPPPAPPSPGRIELIGPQAQSIVCINTETRNGDSPTPGGHAISLGSIADIYLNNSGNLYATGMGYGIRTYAGPETIIINSGAIEAGARGISAMSSGDGYTIDINNSASIVVEGPGGVARRGIYAGIDGYDAVIDIQNSSTIRVTGDQAVSGIRSALSSGNITIINDGALTVLTTSTGDTASGIHAVGLSALGTGGTIDITNRADIIVTSGFNAYGINALTSVASGASIIVNNDALIRTTSDGQDAMGISAVSASFGGRIDIAHAGTIAALNTDGNATGIRAFADGGANPISVRANSGDITVQGYDAFGVRAETQGNASRIDIVNRATIAATGMRHAQGIYAITDLGSVSPIDIESHGDITVSAGDMFESHAYGIRAEARGPNNFAKITNSANITASAGDGGQASADGIFVSTFGGISPITLVNDGNIRATVGDGLASRVYGIRSWAFDGSALNSVVNNGDISVTAGNGDVVRAIGINAPSTVGSSSSSVTSSGDILVVVGDGSNSYASGIYVNTTSYLASSITVVNRGTVKTIVGDGNEARATAINAGTQDASHPIAIVNSGDLASSAGNGALAQSFAIWARSFTGSGSSIAIENAGNAAASVGSGAGARAAGIESFTQSAGSSITITNRGNAGAIAGAGAAGAYGINAYTLADRSGIEIVNQGNAAASGAGYSAGIRAQTEGASTSVTIVNAGRASATGAASYGIVARSFGADSPVLVENAGTAFGGTRAGIYAYSRTATTIVNTGFVSADSLLAIWADGPASAKVLNAGLVHGYVQLTDNPDLFVNQSGGVFETKLVSDFSGGHDLFRNEAGGTVQAATDPDAREHSAFVNLERFENAGVISLQDGTVGDTFEISNTVGQRNLAFAASSGSTLAVDAFLGGPGSQADNFIINGNITGRTALAVHNTNPGPGVFGTVIPVVYANGDVKSDAFFLPQPIDTGFFDYDLFFRPTGSGIFELRSFLGAGAFVLPQLTTAAQDLWYAGSSTWFDRTADLRVLLAGGAAPLAYAPTGSKLDDGVQAPGAVPAVWMRGSGSWLDRDDSASVTAYGRTYQYNLDRELETFDFQVGLDLGTRDVLGSGDILVFGALGGFVHGDLDYDNIVRQFDLSGGQVGGYATYLNGGLFVDTLLNAHFLEVDTPVLGFPGSLDATTIGLRTDAGYRFGSFTGGAFIEPLATIAVTWADLDGFSVGANNVSFDDDANVRGRLGLRAGTSYAAWEGVVMEPFVIGSVWGNLSGDTNSATLTSNGTTFLLNDQLDDVWGEVSAGVNFFNFSSGTTLFAKVDVTFGDDISGVGGKLGMRAAW